MIYGQDKHKKSPSSISLGFYQCRKKGIIRDCKCESNWMQLSNSILHFLFNPREGKTKSERWEKLGEEGVKAVMESIAVQKLVWPSATTKKNMKVTHTVDF